MYVVYMCVYAVRSMYYIMYLLGRSRSFVNICFYYFLSFFGFLFYCPHIKHIPHRTIEKLG